MSDTMIDDGGPAFPCNTGQGYYVEGMTLRAYAAIKLRVPESGIDWLDDMIHKAQRDELAGQALSGWLSSFDATMIHPVRNNTEQSTATDCYKMADAMLAAGKEKV